MFRAWTFRVASREAFRHLRKRRVWMGKHDDDPQLENLPGPEVRPVGELLQQLLAADVVSPASRAVLMLHFQEELSLPETAAILDIPLGTAKSRRAYGLAAIRRHVAGLQSKIRPTNGPEGKTRPTHSGGSHGDHSGETLHRSLNAVDAYRKRMIMALVFLVVLLAVVFFNGADGGGDTLSAFLAHFFILIIWVTALAVIVMMQISVMTKRILRAIELASRK